MKAKTIKASDTQIIKVSLAYRARFGMRTEEFLPTEEGPHIVVFSPGLVVPHPSNRSGDPVRSMRTKELSGTIVVDGCDLVEATGNAVAVQEIPEAERKARARDARKTQQASFEEQIKADPDMARRLNEISATAESLSHSHLNCVMRNLIAGKRGCDCPRGDEEKARGDGEKKNDCTCQALPILNGVGNYDLGKLQKHDNAFSTYARRVSASSCSAGGWM